MHDNAKAPQLIINVSYMHTCQPSRFTTFKTAKNRDVPIFFFFFLRPDFWKKGGEIATDPVWTFNTLILSMKIVFPWPLKLQKARDPRHGLCPWTPGHWVSRFWIFTCWQVCTCNGKLWITFGRKCWHRMYYFEGICGQFFLVKVWV